MTESNTAEDKYNFENNQKELKEAVGNSVFQQGIDKIKRTLNLIDLIASYDNDLTNCFERVNSGTIKQMDNIKKFIIYHYGNEGVEFLENLSDKDRLKNLLFHSILAIGRKPSQIEGNIVLERKNPSVNNVYDGVEEKIKKEIFLFNDYTTYRGDRNEQTELEGMWTSLLLDYLLKVDRKQKMLEQEKTEREQEEKRKEQERIEELKRKKEQEEKERLEKERLEKERIKKEQEERERKQKEREEKLKRKKEQEEKQRIEELKRQKEENILKQEEAKKKAEEEKRKQEELEKQKRDKLIKQRKEREEKLKREKLEEQKLKKQKNRQKINKNSKKKRQQDFLKRMLVATKLFNVNEIENNNEKEYDYKSSIRDNTPGVYAEYILENEYKLTQKQNKVNKKRVRLYRNLNGSDISFENRFAFKKESFNLAQKG